MRELRGEVVEETPSANLDLPMPMAIPTDYIDNANRRDARIDPERLVELVSTRPDAAFS